MGKRGRGLAALCGVLALLAFLPALPARGDEVSRLYDGMVRREQGVAQGQRLRQELRGYVPFGVNDQCLWEALVGDGRLRDRAAAGLYLIECRCPDGDLARWDEVEGWWLPGQIPVPLAVADAALLTAVLAAQLPDPGGPWLALSLLEGLCRSDRGRYFFGRVLPGPVAELRAALSARGVEPLFGWPQVLEVTGTLPLASPLYGTIRVGRALNEGMTFLDGMGRPVGGAGAYAWDRPTGRIYRVVGNEPLFPLLP